MIIVRGKSERNYGWFRRDPGGIEVGPFKRGERNFLHCPHLQSRPQPLAQQGHPHPRHHRGQLKDHPLRGPSGKAGQTGLPVGCESPFRHHPVDLLSGPGPDGVQRPDTKDQARSGWAQKRVAPDGQLPPVGLPHHGVSTEDRGAGPAGGWTPATWKSATRSSTS